MKKFFIIILALTVFGCLVFNFTNKWNYSSRQYIPITEVGEIPAGFVNLEEAIVNYKDFLTYSYFEGAVIFFQSDNTTIMQSQKDDYTFIVSYKNQIYINEKTVNDIIKTAELIETHRNTEYLAGDVIEFYKGNFEFMPFRIDSISYTSEVEELTTASDEWACLIDFTILDKTALENPQNLFNQVELADGSVFSKFFDINSQRTAINLPAGEKCHYIYVQNPIYKNSIRKIVVIN